MKNNPLYVKKTYVESPTNKGGGVKLLAIVLSVLITGGLLYSFLILQGPNYDSLRTPKSETKKLNTTSEESQENSSPVLSKDPLNNKNKDKDNLAYIKKVFPNADLAAPYIQYEIGKKYFEGEEFPQDYSEALKWLTLSASQGFKDSQVLLGEIYYKGLDIEPDYRKAFFFYKLAAEQNSPEAAYILSLMYNEGKGISKNKEEYKNWLKTAALLGHEQAKQDMLANENQGNKNAGKNKNTFQGADKSEIEKYMKSFEKKQKKEREREIIWND